MPPTNAPTTRERFPAVDLLRGAIMIVMALDHTRDFLSNVPFQPENLARSTLPLFLTRWVTHFCAPTFFLLAGLGPALGRPRPTRDVARRFLTRGLWLVAFELTVMAFALTFSVRALPIFALVLWAIGWSMVAMAALVFLPRPAIAAIGLALVLGHNLFDGVAPASLGPLGTLWTVLHVPGFVVPGVLFVGYPLVPWIGVMALGYALGAVYHWEPARRRRFLVRAGLAATVAFVVLRAAHLYGDPQSWTTQRDAAMTLASFLNVRKYPPSLHFLLMTLGPALVALALLERAHGAVARRVAVYGQVPFFYYAVHFTLVHVLAVALALVQGGTAAFLVGSLATAKPPWYGVGLPGVYVAWTLVVLALYEPCRWFAGVKARRRDWWLVYL